MVRSSNTYGTNITKLTGFFFLLFASLILSSSSVLVNILRMVSNLNRASFGSRPLFPLRNLIQQMTRWEREGRKEALRTHCPVGRCPCAKDTLEFSAAVDDGINGRHQVDRLLAGHYTNKDGEIF